MKGLLQGELGLFTGDRLSTVHARPYPVGALLIRCVEDRCLKVRSSQLEFIDSAGLGAPRESRGEVLAVREARFILFHDVSQELDGLIETAFVDRDDGLFVPVESA